MVSFLISSDLVLSAPRMLVHGVFQGVVEQMLENLGLLEVEVAAEVDQGKVF
eukprot:CAMPEP_0197651772 /NCGR_PEP_ID=MMETSP1338-20131121/34043_1 /TAXON_ID=43686 ORGANISM="Pelagodinium beii, Strain RCC1491" /NCGR_SAMPLE_ID=MMETSP1338 /ASSEMBLY_ACC=CAM_ASM_000754 /LENGTH=51 /DNA_ID=CAMNT_0043226505 /DNA_START=41 /DNA_END=196 /DNA_ORIENTATION=-